MYSERKSNGVLKILLTIVLTTVGLAVLIFVFSGYFTSNSPPPQNPQVQEPNSVPQPQQLAVETPSNVTDTPNVAKSATPGVVGISVLKSDTGKLFDSNATQNWAVGSGVITSSNGYILTNNHVAGGKNKRIVVSLADGRSTDGVTMWSDPVLDLAVVKISMTGLPTIPLGNANTLQVGEQAIAIGNPLGLQFQRSVTSGIISALNRTIKIDTDQGSNYMEDLIQTDASINPGNSGGPLLNSKGEVVGINTIKVTSAEGMGFAIPINVAVPIIKQFNEKGQFTEAYLGVFAYDKEIIPLLNSNIQLDNGIYVANVDTSGPAYKSGIQVGCIIKEVDGNPVNTMMELRSYIYTKSPGDTINVTHLMKDGKIITVPIKLTVKPKDGLVTR